MDREDRELSLEYTRQGNGPTVILIHGLGSSRRDWLALVPQRDWCRGLGSRISVEVGVSGL